MTTYDEYILKSQVLLYQQEDGSAAAETLQTRQLALSFHLEMMTKLGLVFRHTFELKRGCQYMGFTIALAQLVGSAGVRNYVRVSRVDAKCPIVGEIHAGDELLCINNKLIVNPQAATFKQLQRCIYGGGKRCTLTFVKGVPTSETTTTFVPVSVRVGAPDDYGIHDVLPPAKTASGSREDHGSSSAAVAKAAAAADGKKKTKKKTTTKTTTKQQQQQQAQQSSADGDKLKSKKKKPDVEDTAVRSGKKVRQPQDVPEASSASSASSADSDNSSSAAASSSSSREALRRILAHHLQEMDEAGLVVRHTFTEETLGFSLSLATKGGRDFLEVSKTEQRCPLYPERLRPGDELIAMDDNLIVNPRQDNFYRIIESIQTAARPLHLTFVEGVARDALFRQQQLRHEAPPLLEQETFIRGGESCSLFGEVVLPRPARRADWLSYVVGGGAEGLGDGEDDDSLVFCAPGLQWDSLDVYAEGLEAQDDTRDVPPPPRRRTIDLVHDESDSY